MGHIYIVSSAVLPEQDFGIVSDCFDENFSLINDAFITKEGEYLNNDSIKGIVLAGAELITHEASCPTLLKKANMEYVCDDGKRIYIDHHAITTISMKPEPRNSDPLVAVGLDGWLRSVKGDGKNPDEPTDRMLADNLALMKSEIFSQKCLDKEGRNLQDLISSLPNKITYFKNTTVNAQNTKITPVVVPTNDAKSNVNPQTKP